MSQLALLEGRAGALHVLGAPLIARRAAPYLERDEVNWEGLLAASTRMSVGERLLVRVAYELSQAKVTACFWELPRSLDRSNFHRVLEALTIACRGASVTSL